VVRDRCERPGDPNKKDEVKAVLLAAVVAAFLAGTARAAAPEAVSIHLYPSQFCCPEIGTWTATGAVTDAGGYERSDGHGTGSMPDCFCNPEHTGAFSETFLLTSSRGTLIIRDEERLVPTADGSYPPSRGVWQISDGTGAYGSASGHGDSRFFRTPIFDLALNGVISKGS
jgi:hypothetical protein